MCEPLYLGLMYVFTVLLLRAFLIVMREYLSFLIVMLRVIDFRGPEIISEYERCFNIDARIYGTVAHPGFFVILLLISPSPST